MPRTRVGLTGSALKVMGQVAASMGATLIAAMVFASLPKATVAVDRPAAELTSGGKFAARIPEAENAAAEDRPARARFILPLRSAAQAPLDAVAGTGKQPADSVAAAAESTGMASGVGIAPKPDDGMMTRVSSAVRSLWSVAAGAGASSLTHAAP